MKKKNHCRLLAFEILVASLWIPFAFVMDPAVMGFSLPVRQVHPSQKYQSSTMTNSYAADRYATNTAFFFSPSRCHPMKTSRLFSGPDNVESSDNGESSNSGAESQNSNDETTDEQDEQRKRPSTTRVGGRTFSKQPKKSNDNTKGALTKWAWIVVPAMAVLFLLKSLFFGGGSEQQSGYVYYQSSVYQSQVITPDGKVETSRKESMRSNIPSFINADKQQNGKYLLRESPDQEFDRELESVMRMQRELMNDFFF